MEDEIMKKLIAILVCGLFIFSSAYAQKIKGKSAYFPHIDSIYIDQSEINYLINHCRIICSKIDTLSDGGLIKTVELVSTDTTFRFVGAYMESNIIYPQEFRSYVLEGKKVYLRCAFVVIDNGELYQTFELDIVGRKKFERILNLSKLKCIDYYQWKDKLWLDFTVRVFLIFTN